MYAAIRRYNVGREIALDVSRRSYTELRTALSRRPGFVAYEIVIGDDSFASITVFETWVSAEESNVVAADWIRKNVTGRNIAQAEVTAGEVFELPGAAHRPFAAPDQTWTDGNAEPAPVVSLVRRLLGRNR